jgi:hypothetical protein
MNSRVHAVKVRQKANKIYRHIKDVGTDVAPNLWVTMFTFVGKKKLVNGIQGLLPDTWCK